MAHCCNCGIEIPADDKTKLCDRCKKIILPFVKFMDASTSSAVRRLVSNERNLRNAGVTDGGMDYLFRICELHDKQKAQERKAREEAKQNHVPEPVPEPVVQEEIGYSEEELPLDAPLNLRRKPYGGLLTAAEVILILAGIALIGLCVYEYIALEEINLIAPAAGIGAFFSAYVADTARKILSDLEEIKKHFR